MVSDGWRWLMAHVRALPVLQSSRAAKAMVLARLRPVGMLILDNALWGGRVVERHRSPGDTDLQTICALNDAAAADARVQPAFLPLGDGLILLRKCLGAAIFS